MRPPLAHAVGIAGILFSVLGVAAIVLMAGQPSPSDSDAQVAAWFGDSANTTKVIVGTHLSAFAAMAFIWFLAAVRARIGDRVDRFLGLVFMASGILCVACILVAAAAWGAIAVAVEQYDASEVATAQIAGLVRGFAYDAAVVAGCRIASMFVIATSTIGLRTKTLPRPLVIVGYLVALALFAGATRIELTIALFPLWVCLVSVELIWRGIAGRGPARDPARSDGGDG